MATRPRALDLFCKAGGASEGLHRAGFDVVGVDIEPQANYPFPFIRADVRAIDFAGWDFIWASPPCQRWTAPAQQRGTWRFHPDLVAPMQGRLRASGALYCIENVPRSPIRATIILTGDMFDAKTYRKRHFETNFLVLTPRPGKPFGPKTRPDAVTVAGSSGGKSNRDQWQNGNKAAWQAAMGIDWMTNEEMANAVPPAYAEHIGLAAIEALSARRGAA